MVHANSLCALISSFTTLNAHGAAWMKMRSLIVSAVASLGIAAACAASADAATLVATYTGTVSSGYDQTGLFGTAGGDLAGAAYTVKYTIDTTKGVYVNNLPSHDALYGGSDYGTSSPVSATVTINGITLSIGGETVGEDTNSWNWQANYAAQSHGTDNGVTYKFDVSNYSYSVADSLLDTVPLYPGYHIWGSFAWRVYDSNISQYTAFTTADLTDLSQNGTFQVSALGGVPEPDTWVMMLLGVGMIGGSLRIARHKSGIAVAAA